MNGMFYFYLFITTFFQLFQSHSRNHEATADLYVLTKTAAMHRKIIIISSINNRESIDRSIAMQRMHEHMYLRLYSHK